MKLKSTDSVKKLFLLFGQGFISNDEYIQLVDSRSVKMGYHLYWSLEQFGTLLQLKDDVKIVKFLLSIEKEKLSLPKKIFFTDNILKLKVGQYLDLLKFAKDGMTDINTALSEIKQPKMSSEMVEAGFGSLNFEDRGMARTVGNFEGIGTIEAYNLPMHFILQSLNDLANIKTCEKQHQDIMEAKSKAKK